MKYKYKGVWVRGVPASKVAEYLNKLANKNKLTPEEIVRDSKKKSSLLHHYFNWDDKSAAHEWRLAQARNLVCSVTVVDEHNGVKAETRAFVNVSVKESGDGDFNPGFNGSDSRYATIQTVLSNPFSKEYVIERAFQELEHFKNKYEHLQEFADLFKLIEKKRKKVS